MSPSTQSRRRYARFLSAWVFILLGFLFAVPSIWQVVAAILSFRAHWTWREYISHFQYSEIAVGVFFYGMPAILAWSIAWRLRSARPLHPSVFYVLAVLSALFFAPYPMRSQVWIVVPVYLTMGAFIHLLRLNPPIQFLPGTPSELLDRLMMMFPEFRQYWQSDQNCFLGESGEITYCGVFAHFSHYFRERYDSVSATDMERLGVLVSKCVDLSVEKLSIAATTCFLENLVGENCLNSLRPHLSGASLDFLDQLSDSTSENSQ